jgi:hypothetical protein
MAKKCVLVHPDTGQKYSAEIISKEKTRLIVKPEGTKIEIMLVRGDETIPYRGRFKGQYYTVQI